MVLVSCRLLCFCGGGTGLRIFFFVALADPPFAVLDAFLSRLPGRILTIKPPVDCAVDVLLVLSLLELGGGVLLLLLLTVVLASVRATNGDEAEGAQRLSPPPFLVRASDGELLVLPWEVPFLRLRAAGWADECRLLLRRSVARRSCIRLPMGGNSGGLGAGHSDSEDCACAASAADHTEGRVGHARECSEQVLMVTASNICTPITTMAPSEPVPLEYTPCALCDPRYSQPGHQILSLCCPYPPCPPQSPLHKVVGGSAVCVCRLHGDSLQDRFR